MSVITIALGVALGIFIVVLTPIILLSVVAGVVAVYDYFQPERTYIHEVDPVDGSTNVFAIDPDRIYPEGLDVELEEGDDAGDGS